MHFFSPQLGEQGGGKLSKIVFISMSLADFQLISLKMIPREAQLLVTSWVFL